MYIRVSISFAVWSVTTASTYTVGYHSNHCKNINIGNRWKKCENSRSKNSFVGLCTSGLKNRY